MGGCSPARDRVFFIKIRGVVQARGADVITFRPTIEQTYTVSGNQHTAETIGKTIVRPRL